MRRVRAEAWAGLRGMGSRGGRPPGRVLGVGNGGSSPLCPPGSLVPVQG